MKRLIYVGQDDDISDLAGRLQSAAEGDEVALVVPSGAQSFQTPLHLRLLHQLGTKHGHGISLVTPDPRLQAQAREAGLGTFSSVPAFESGVAVGPPRPAGMPAGGPPGAAGSAGSPPAGGGGSPAGAPPGDTGEAPWGRPATPIAPEGGDPAAPPPWDRASRPFGQTTPPPATLEFERGPAGTGPGTEWPQARPGWPSSPESGPGAPSWPPPPGGGAGGGAVRHAGWEAAGTAGLAAGDSFMAGGTATAVAPPPARPQAVAASERGAARPAPPAPPRRGGRWRRGAPLYFVLLGIAVAGIVLYLALSPSATVTITVVEQPLSVNPVIQGASSPVPAGQANQIQTQVVTASGTQKFTATPTGTKTIPAVPATGQVVLKLQPGSLCPQQTGPPQPCYASGAQGKIPKGQIFQTTGTTPVQFAVTADTAITIPPKGGWSNGIPVAATNPGSSGNVGQGAITDWVNCDSQPSCQQEQLQITNPQATSGGTDPSQETVASSGDIQGWQNQVSQICGQLTGKAKSDLAAKASTGKIAQAPDQGGETVSCSASPDVTRLAPGDQMAQKSETVTVTASGQATVYNLTDIEKAVYADLQASNNLPKGDSLASTTPTLTNLDVIQAASDGTLSLSVAGSDFYRPAALNLGVLKDQLTGHNPRDVAGIVEKQLGDVKSVTVSEHPFTLFYMPFFASNIQITQRYVAGPAASAAT